MTPYREIRGVLPVLSTPFNSSDEIDEKVLQAEITWVLVQGADGVTTGMVSEILRLSVQERMRLHEVVAQTAKPLGGLVILSAGAESTKQAIAFSLHAQSCGADAVMVNPPISTSLDDEETYGYYASILDKTDIPVIVQDASGYVGKPLSIEMQVELLNSFGKRVYFKPEAVPIGPRLSRFMEATGNTARVFEGSGGGALVDTFHRGVIGTMPGADIPWALVALWKALNSGDWTVIDAIAGPLASLIDLQHSLDAYLAIEKFLLLKQGVFTNVIVREPVGYRLDEKTQAEAERLYLLLRSRALGN